MLIVHAEPAVHRFLRNRLSRHGRFQVDGSVGSIREARLLLQSHQFDLVFIGVRSQDESLAEFVPILPPDADRVLLDSKDSSFLAGLSDPWFAHVADPLCRKSIDDVLERFLTSEKQATIRSSARTEGRHRRVFLPDATGKNLQSVELQTIRLIVAEREYTRILLERGQAVHLRKPLLEWEKELPFPEFVRVHRGAIVNTGLITRVQRKGRKVLLDLAGVGNPVAVSYRSASSLNRALRASGRTVSG